MSISPFAGKPIPIQMVINVPQLITSYFLESPDMTVKEQRVCFGTSGHRGSPFSKSFNEKHILAIAQAIILYRKQQKIDGPLFLGIDTHPLSQPALATTLEVLAANDIIVMLAENNDFTPTPVISHAILNYNRGRKNGLADGIVITPSHNPPDEAGIKYNPPHGGPAEQNITQWIELTANKFIENDLREVKRIPHEKALQASTTKRFDYIDHYVSDLKNVIDMDLIKNSKIKLGVDPLGGAGINYWPRIAEKYGINLTIVNNRIDYTFSFMTADWDGKIRMDPSSPYAMSSLIGLKDKFDVAFACDTDYDRHGIVAKSIGLMAPNHYLSVAIDYLFKHRPQWSPKAAIGKTLVSSSMIDRVAAGLNRNVVEVPVGFKWFVDGLYDGSLAFVGEESAGASFLRKDGSVWTTDKDGMIMCLLAAEMRAKTGQDPGEIYKNLEKKYGAPTYVRIDAIATPEQKELIKKLSPQQIHKQTLAGEKIEAILTKAPGNNAAIGGVKVVTKNGWFAARPSGTENIYKIYAESFVSEEHLEHIVSEARSIVNDALNTTASSAHK